MTSKKKIKTSQQPKRIQICWQKTYFHQWTILENTDILIARQLQIHNLIKLFLLTFMLTSSINSFAQPWALAAENQISLMYSSYNKIKKQNLESVEQVTSLGLRQKTLC